MADELLAHLQAAYDDPQVAEMLSRLVTAAIADVHDGGELPTPAPSRLLAALLDPDPEQSLSDLLDELARQTPRSS